MTDHHEDTKWTTITNDLVVIQRSLFLDDDLRTGA
jgi:hypothetical protein